MNDDADWASQVEYWETHGHPDSELPINDGDYNKAKYYVGLNKPKVDHIFVEEDKDSWYDRDNDARSPLEADLDERIYD